MSVRTDPDCAPAVLGEQQVVSVEAPAPAVQTPTPAVPISVALPQQQAALPITVQGCSQVCLSIYTHISRICRYHVITVCQGKGQTFILLLALT